MLSPPLRAVVALTAANAAYYLFMLALEPDASGLAAGSLRSASEPST